MTLHVYRAHCAESAAAHEIRMAEMEHEPIQHPRPSPGRQPMWHRRAVHARGQLDVAARHWVMAVAEMMEWVNR